MLKSMDILLRIMFWLFFFFQAEDGIRVLVRSRGLGDVYKRQLLSPTVLDSVGERVAVEMIDLSTNRTRTLARLDRKLNGPRLGPYHFDARTLTWGHNVLARAIARGCDLLVIDEIGRLELEQDAGLDVVPLLASNALPLSVFVVRSPLLQLFHQQLPGVATMQFEITLDNRAAASAQVARLLGLP